MQLTKAKQQRIIRPMDIEIIKSTGLTEPQAKAYLLLMQNGVMTPPQLAEEIAETRTNAYAIFERLSALKLARKDASRSKLTYLPTNPVNLEKFIELRRNQIINNEYKFKSILPGLMKQYYSVAEQPAVRFYQGRDGLDHIYDDILRVGADFHLIMTPAENDFMGEEYMNKFVAQRVKAGIKVTALTPDTFEANHNPALDKKILFKRYWYDPKAFDAPVEINIYGRKVAFLSFGEEIIGTVIDSPQIAQSMRLIFEMLRSSSRPAS